MQHKHMQYFPLNARGRCFTILVSMNLHSFILQTPWPACRYQNKRSSNANTLWFHGKVRTFSFLFLNFFFHLLTILILIYFVLYCHFIPHLYETNATSLFFHPVLTTPGSAAVIHRKSLFCFCAFVVSVCYRVCHTPLSFLSHAGLGSFTQQRSSQPTRVEKSEWDGGKSLLACDRP